MRALLAAAFTAVAVLTVLPPVGSTDILDYAAYGRTVVIGRNPYVMTPGQLRRIRDPIGEAAPHAWSKRYSPYGPLATAEQAAAANLGGTSAARITFWLKLWNSLAFCAVVLALDRLLRTDPARRARAHLLWSLNPLLLWNLVAGGHIDALAAGVGFLGLTLVSAPRRGERPGALAGLAAGALVGAAADIKITFALFGLAVAGTVRRSPVALTAAVGGAAAVLVPTYLWFGEPALAVLVRRSTAVTSDNFYQLFSRAFGDAVPPHLVWVVVPLFAAVAALLLARLPEGCPALPAVRPAFALSAAWLLVWPYQRPWYDAIVLCLLALYPASRLDWVLLARFVAGTFFYVPGMPVGLPSGWMARVGQVEHVPVVPLVMLGALAATVVLAITGAWRPGRERERGAGHRTAQRPVAG